MFLKAVTPTREHPIAFDENRLLDYEVELCAKPIHPVNLKSVKHAQFAFFLCGDFTDRAALMRNVDPSNLQSGKGFSKAKSLPGYFPTGPYLVIPKNQEMFLNHVSLSLTYNGQQMQIASTKDLIWRLPKILSHLLSLTESNQPTYSEIKTWLPSRGLDNEISFLTGTPDGVLMRPPNLWYKVKMAIWYFVSFHFLTNDDSIRQYVLENYLAKQFENKHYLQSGDNIVLSARWLGLIHVHIQ
ncbi:fumarylacetoacetate hydrolase family protein [Marinibactrum halimedae]|uniref:Fumarylacetoacetase-like C-terminal domain-containing protein n=1 Tax=Marinibactrum halimedae TaxID=1444977 RepID=A0AA37T6D9_9GAMM|nr:fumarylacetoacetate hydrolase family protein [Marinibactrum halimedae]MCD9460892.1 fumarylacetoacetate hydrolase family protein [Marinibactrum halimedae]GLS24566.1 hypothetical protein GCM10007877_02800 [Marinibactrum halimedae]